MLKMTIVTILLSISLFSAIANATTQNDDLSLKETGFNHFTVDLRKNTYRYHFNHEYDEADVESIKTEVENASEALFEVNKQGKKKYLKFNT